MKSPKTGEVTAKQERTEMHGSGFMPFESKPEPGTFDTYRKIRKNPTVALARLIATSPIRTAKWTLASDDKKAKEFIKEQLDRLWPGFINDVLFALDYGFACFENVWENVDGKLVIQRMKPLLPDMTEMIVGVEHGEFLGVKNKDIEIRGAKVFRYTYNEEAGNYYGESRHENIRETAYKEWVDLQQRRSVYGRRVAGAVPQVTAPDGDSISEAGATRPNFELAREMVTKLEKGLGIFMPGLSKIEMVDILNRGGDPSKANAWKIDFLESAGQHGAELTEMMTHCETLFMRGWLCPERGAIEARQQGSRADSDTGADLAVTIADIVYADIIRAVNEQLVDALLLQNFEPGLVKIVRGGVEPELLSFYRGIMTTVLGNPSNVELLETKVDLEKVMEDCGLPKNEHPEKAQAEIDAKQQQGGEPPFGNLKKAMSQLYHSVNREYDIPFLAGTSIDGATVYIDKDFPDTIEVEGQTYNPTMALTAHETAEDDGIHEGLTYFEAHDQLGLPAERAVVEAAGIDFDSYNKALQPYIDKCKAKIAPNIPEDLELQPYREENYSLANTYHDHVGRFTSGASKHYEIQKANNENLSRSAKGVADTSSSIDKPPLALNGRDLSQQVDENTKEVGRIIHAARDFQPLDGEDVKDKIFELEAAVNKGIATGPVLREWTHDNLPADKVPEEFEKVCDTIAKRWQEVHTDPVPLASWVEWQLNGSPLHPFTDGCGRTSRAVGAMIMNAGGKQYPIHQSKMDYYEAGNTGKLAEYYAKGLSLFDESKHRRDSSGRWSESSNNVHWAEGAANASREKIATDPAYGDTKQGKFFPVGFDCNDAHTYATKLFAGLKEDYAKWQNIRGEFRDTVLQFKDLPWNDPKADPLDEKINSLARSGVEIERGILAKESALNTRFFAKLKTDSPLTTEIQPGQIIATGIKRGLKFFESHVNSRVWETKESVKCEQVPEFVGSNYDPDDRTARISNSGMIPVAQEATHELGHALEFHSDSIHKTVVDFFTKRTAGQTPVTYYDALKDWEAKQGWKQWGMPINQPAEDAKRVMVIPDNFFEPYAGRVYDSATHGDLNDYGETFSMGVERMMAHPLFFAQEDPEHFKMIYRCLTGNPKALGLFDESKHTRDEAGEFAAQRSDTAKEVSRSLHVDLDDSFPEGKTEAEKAVASIWKAKMHEEWAKAHLYQHPAAYRIQHQEAIDLHNHAKEAHEELAYDYWKDKGDIAAEDTQTRHRTGEGYTPERKYLHNACLKFYERNAKPVETPTVYMMGGGTASGKSTIKDTLGLPKNSVGVDADDIKSWLPEYTKGLKRKEESAAYYAHEESSDVAKALLKDAVGKKLNVVYDCTGDSGLEAARKRVADLHEAGAKVVANFCTCDVDTAIQRANKRIRPVHEETVRALHRGVSEVLPKMYKDFDACTLWDTDGEKTKVMSWDGKNTTIHDEGKWARFKDKENE